jgi:hypothetical protein
MKYAFSTARVASSMTLMPCLWHRALDRGDVRHADRLPAGHVHAALEVDVGDAGRAVLVDDRLELVQIDVALEGLGAGDVVGRVADDVDESPAGEFLVRASGREVHVAGHDVAGLDHHAAEDVLGAASLVGRDEVLVAVVPMDRVLEVVVVDAPGVGLVAEHQPGPLAVAHGAGARVGEQVDVDILAAEKEGVEPGPAIAASRSSGVVMRRGSTILILKGSAQERLFIEAPRSGAESDRAAAVAARTIHD